MNPVSRRRFIQSTSLAGASFFIAGTQVSGKVFGANERLRIAVIGLNGRGKSHISAWLEQPNVEIAYLVDPDRNLLDVRLKDLEKRTPGAFKTKGVTDLRVVLADKNVDAISVATPNHWHSLMTIWGAQAGKHVYVEKPMSHDIAEGRIAVEAQKKYGVVVQHGTQRRSDSGYAGLTKAIQDGKYGRLKIAYGYCCKPRDTIGYQPQTEAPSHLDWDLWRGPANIGDYHANYVHYNWHWFWKSGNGDMNNQGTHQLDVAGWAIDPDQTHPSRVMGMGGRFAWHDQGETPNTMFAIAEYPNGQQVFFNVRNVNHPGYERQILNEYYFEDGGRIVREPGYIRDDSKGLYNEFYNHRYYSKGAKHGEPLEKFEGDVTPGGTWGSFIAACRAGKPEMANGDAEAAHKASVLGHLMNNSYRLGTTVPFNEKAGRFGENTEAYEHFSRLHDIMGNKVGLPADKVGYTVGPWLTFNPETERHEGEFATEANQLLQDTNRKGFEVPTIAEL